MRNRLTLRLLSATALAAGLFASTSAWAGEITGRVGADGGNVSLAGVQVEIVELGRSTATDRDGTYRFQDVTAGTYTLRLTYASGEPVTRRVQVPAVGTVTEDVALGEADGMEEIVVVGQRATLASAVSRQRAADGIASVLTRDSIGQFPDQNVAESVRRLPGVNVLNDQGEGRFIAVRGLDPNLNSASINGVRTPSPEADVRSVALDVIPSELIESIEVKKTLTPDMDADTIGASIEINTTSALERKDTYIGAKIEGSFNELSDVWSPKGSLDVSAMLTDRLGVAAGVSYYKRRFETDNIEAEGWDEEGGVVYATEIQYRDYDVIRERIGGNLNFDLMASDSTDLFLRGLYSQFDDQEHRRRLIFDMEDAVPNTGTGTTAAFDSADGERFTVIRDQKDRFESQTITTVSLGGETRLNAWTFDYSAGYAYAEEKEDGSLDPGRFRQRFSGTGTSRGTVTFDYSDLGKPAFAFGTGSGNFNNASRYAFYRLEETDLSASEDEEWSAQFDAARVFGLDQGEVELKFGGKARLRNKTYDLNINYFDGYDGTFTLADVGGSATYKIADLGVVPDKVLFTQFINDNRANLELSDLDTAFESAIADYDVDEDVYAGYVMGRYESDRLRLIGGVRVEHTENNLGGNVVELVEEGAVRNGQPLTEDTVFVDPFSAGKSYTDFMPSVALRFEAGEDLLVRLGGFRSIVRPGIGQLAPRFIIEESEDGEREGEFGNPELDPYRAWNLDASLEWYFAREAVLSGGVFWKSIKDFIVLAEFEDGSFRGIAYDEALIPINGDDAEVLGFEVNYQQSLLFLPAPLDGLVASVNYTYTDAEGDVLGRTVPLPAASKHTYTAVLGYENGPFSLRVAATYRDEYLDELASDPLEDRYVKDHLQWDITSKVQVTDNIQLFGELINITDEPYLAFQKGPEGDRLLQYEEYSWTAKFGARLTF